MALTSTMFVGCTPDDATEAEVTYEVVGGISEPTRVWNEVESDAEEVAPAEEEAPAIGEEYTPDVLAMNPKAFVANKVAELLTSDKDGEVVGTLAEGEEVTLVGTTGKGYYATEDGYFISVSDVVAKVETAEVVEAETKPVTTTQAPTTTTAPTQQESQSPSQEQESQPAQ